MKSLLIRASAGTGKTYRLSLECINLLLKYRIHFEEILVITFTKKATAEIRERIFTQLKEIVEETEAGESFKQSLKQDINPELTFDEAEMDFLRKSYKNMITQKNAVRISTIDSFINTIFSGIIAPYHNITEFQIDNEINTEILPEIYDAILADHDFEVYRDLFLKAKQRNLNSLNKFVNDLIENRWLFEFIDLSNFDENKVKLQADNAFEKYQHALKIFLDLLQSEIRQKKSITITDFFNSAFKKGIDAYLPLSSLDISQLAQRLYELLTDNFFLEENYNLLLEEKIWNGNKLRNPDLKVIFAEIQLHCADYIYFTQALEEQWQIISLAGKILQKYDEIKFRDRIFTHGDISYYTFRFLYDPQISLVAKENVLNLFYEQLTFHTRFVLIDEFQDTSILQWKIFHPMLTEICSGIGQKDYGSIIVVGDEKQAIYGWRGGERKLLTDFDTILNEPVQEAFLSTSYRSKPVLIDWLNKIFGSPYLDFVPEWNYEPIKCHKREGGYVRLDLINTYDDGKKKELYEIYQEFVTNILAANLSSGKINPADTAILLRKNKELTVMASVLDAAGIAYTYEISGSLFAHPAVKAVLFVLNFLVYEDVWELIKFLRSDLILMNPATLKKVIKIYREAEDLDTFLLNCDVHYSFAILGKLRNYRGSLLVLIKKILENFGFAQVFGSEIELKNLQRFLEIAAEFEHSIHDYPNNTAGFLQYCRSLKDKDEYSQIGQSVSDSIRLMTIHKSKGLQFETVFTVFDIAGKGGNYNSGLHIYYRFSDDFLGLQDVAFTYNYDKVLQCSHKKNLLEYHRQKEVGDELNNLYVALTRAKNNLFIYFHYQKSGGFEKLINDRKSKETVLKNFAKAIYLDFQQDAVQRTADYLRLEFGSVSKDTETSSQEVPDDFELPDLFKFDDQQDIPETEKPNLHRLETEFLQNKSVLIGNIVHDYLSHIRYRQEDEMIIAKNRTVSKFGNLISHQELTKIIAKIDKFIEENPDIFNPNIWSIVFNEMSIFNNFGHEFRIDRMMIDFRNKIVKIIDFKTGSIHEQDQLDRYKRIIERLPIVKKENYTVETEYVKIVI